MRLLSACSLLASCWYRATLGCSAGSRASCSEARARSRASSGARQWMSLLDVPLGCVLWTSTWPGHVPQFCFPPQAFGAPPPRLKYKKGCALEIRMVTATPLLASWLPIENALSKSLSGTLSLSACTAPRDAAVHVRESSMCQCAWIGIGMTTGKDQ